MSREQIRSRLEDLTFSLDQIRNDLQQAQTDYEDAFNEWEGDESEDKGDKPDHIDNTGEIDALDRAKSLIESAIAELGDET